MYIYTREANINDIEKILYLGKKVYEKYMKERSDWIVKNPLNYDLIKYIIENNGYKLFVVEKMDDKYEILGYCILSINEIKNHYMFKNMVNIEIDDFYTEDKYYNYSIEKTLFDKVNEYAKEIGANNIELNVWEFNYKIKRFFENMGMNTRIYRMEIKVN